MKMYNVKECVFLHMFEMINYVTHILNTELLESKIELFCIFRIPKFIEFQNWIKASFYPVRYFYFQNYLIDHWSCHPLSCQTSRYTQVYFLTVAVILKHISRESPSFRACRGIDTLLLSKVMHDVSKGQAHIHDKNPFSIHPHNLVPEELYSLRTPPHHLSLKVSVPQENIGVLQNSSYKLKGK